MKKKTSGRKSEGLGDKFSVQLYEADEAKVEELARKENRTKSKMMRQIVAQYFAFKG